MQFLKLKEENEGSYIGEHLFLGFFLPLNTEQDRIRTG